MKRQYPCIQQSVFKFVLTAFNFAGREEKQKEDTLMRLASPKISDGHHDGQRAEAHDV